MPSYKQPQKQIVAMPQGLTTDMAQAIVSKKVEFFSKVFTKEDVLSHPKSVYSTIINSPDNSGTTLEKALGTENAKMEMTSIMFQLTTGHSHT